MPISKWVGEAVRLFSANTGKGKGRWTAKCPSHDDRSRSTLSIKEGNKGVLIHCWAGCPKEAILAAAGIRFTDLFYHSRDVSSEALKKIRHQQAIDRMYDAEIRHQNMTMMLNAVNLKPYQRCKRSRSTFDILVEKAYQ